MQPEHLAAGDDAEQLSVVLNRTDEHGRVSLLPGRCRLEGEEQILTQSTCDRELVRVD